MTRRAPVALEPVEANGEEQSPPPEPAARPSATDALVREVRYLLRARNHLIWVSTSEERRAEQIVAAAAAKENYLVRFWDCATGAHGLDGKKVEIAADGLPESLPAAVFEKIRASLPPSQTWERAVWILRDLHDWLGADQVMNVRALKSLVRDLQDLPGRAVEEKSRFNVVVVLSAAEEVPLSLRNAALRMDWPLPERAEVLATLEDTLLVSPRKRVSGEDGAERTETTEELRARLLCPDGGSVEEGISAAVDAALGLTLEEVASSFSKSLVRHRRIDPGVIAAEKKALVSRVPGLTWCQPDPRGLSAIAGLDLLKEELLDMRTALAPEAREYGLLAPRGILLAGPPGCGKSATAKASAEAFKIPLLKLDLGAMKTSSLGGSEGNIRRALRTIEALGTCVVWVDEIDRSMPAPGAYEGDSGVGKDQVGTLLNFLQEHKGFIFLVATTNEPNRLGPELTRAGRFNATFFCDLPNVEERAEVLAVSLRALPKPRDPSRFDLRAVARVTEDYSGAELSEIASAALRKAFRAGREVATGDLLTAAQETIPVARSAAQRMAELREWARTRARPASSPPTTLSGALQPAPRLEFEEEDIQ